MMNIVLEIPIDYLFGIATGVILGALLTVVIDK